MSWVEKYITNIVIPFKQIKNIKPFTAWRCLWKTNYLEETHPTYLECNIVSLIHCVNSSNKAHVS